MRNKRGPVPIGNIVADILARKGLGRHEATIELDKVWAKIVEKPLAEITRCGRIRRQQLEVVVENSTAMQELTFRKQELIELLNREIPQQKLKDIRFRVGTIQKKNKTH